MAITFPLAFPTITGLSQITLRAKSSVSVSSSPFTFTQQVQINQGRAWEADISIPPTKRASAEEWIAFLLKLNGPEGTFLMGDPTGATARGSASTTPGTPVVNGASQTGGSLIIDGLPSGITEYLLAGDYIQLGATTTASLFKVLNDANTDSGGNATLDIWPDLRSSPADNATITLASPVGRFRLASSVSSWSVDVAEFYGISFSAMEAI